jgi:class 3 adenylate cyclase
VRCTACDRENRDDAAFCAQCGTPLTPSCTSCGRELVPDSRFCDGCGAPVGAATPHDASRVDDGSAARKTVTAMFCDLVGSTSFGERVEAESARTAMAEYFELVRSVADDHRGTVAKFIGDGALVLFGVPQMAEDDAERAVGAALDLQRRFAPLGARIGQRHGSEIGLRVGINTGELVIAHGDDDLVGDTLNTAARLESACPAGGVMVGEPTWRLTRAAFDYRAHGVIEAKGKRHPVVGYEAVAPHMESEGRGTPFVGRASELDTLRATLDEAIAVRTARMVTVIGEPGVGKTRLTT